MKQLFLLLLFGIFSLVAYGQDLVVDSNLLVNGKMGIDCYPTNKLEVNGTARAKEVIANSYNWPDFVFDKAYKLASLAEVEEHINEQGHLPEIPSAAEVAENGINLSEINIKLLQKVEELTLYIIAQNKDIQQLQKEVESLQQQNNVK